MLILDLWGISFHALVGFGLGKNLLFKSVLGHCVMGLNPGYLLIFFFYFTYRIVLLAVRFTILLKEFSVNSPFTDTALKALFMVDLAKGCATIFFNWFHTYTTFS